MSSTTVMSQLDPSQRRTQVFVETHLCLCGYDGLLGDHLRNSKQCVDDLRNQPQLRMTVPNDEVFVVKATIILRGCPAPGCPGGLHRQIPENCLFWWREVGWKVMGWKGSSENAGGAEIKRKESKFRRNFLHRSIQIDGSSNADDGDCNQPSQQTRNTRFDSQREVEKCCQFCQNQELVIPHLYQSKPCLRAYVKHNLPKQAQSYIGKSDLAMFDLSLMIQVCANPRCVGNFQLEGLNRHLQGVCLQFYQEEGEKLFQWDSALDKTSVCDRLKKRKSWLKTLLKDNRMYEEDIANALRMECFRCKIRGPLLDDSVHKMLPAGIDQGTGGLLWECARCRKDNQSHRELVSNAIKRAAELGAPIESDDSMKMVSVEDTQHHRQRIVFVPACLVPDDYTVPNISDAELNPLHTTVLVPKNPEALDQIGDEASERAKLAKESLERIAEYFGRRFLVGPVTDCVSVFYRLKIAQIRIERLNMLSIMKKTSKGKVKSLNPNQASCKERKPHFATTQKFCLTNTCSWSPSAQEKRSQESAARACVNGRVKIKVDVTILKKLAMDSPHLKDIISETLLLHGSPLISLAPLVLNYLKAKVGLLVKHFFSQTFKNWDLNLRFSEKEWTVRLVGFLYCEEYEELNSKIATGVVCPEEMTKEVIRHRHLLPTTTTSRREIMEAYKMTEEQAGEIVKLAEKHQKTGQSEPLSLLTMFTPGGLGALENELVLRRRAAELSKSFGEEVGVVDAIVEIIRILAQEGLQDIDLHPDHLRSIREWLLLSQDREHAYNEDIILYHTLLWKTGDEGKWTMKRNPSECEIVSYIPALLGASGLPMSAEISTEGDHLLSEEGRVSEELKSVVENPEDWQEISFLDFINSSLPCRKVPQATGPTSQTIIQVIATKDRNWTWRGALDSDNHAGETIFSSEDGKLVVRTNNDVRKLYEERPDCMQPMRLGQLATDYRYLKPSDWGYEKAKNSIDEESNVGPNSKDLVAGTSDIFAPTAMRLTSDRIMKRKTERKAVPHLQFFGSTSRHGNQLMWEPWQNLEEVTGNQNEVETENQKKTRLQIFPLSIFPTVHDDGDDDEPCD